MPDIASPAYSLVLDTTVLSNFAAINQLHLLESFYQGQACTTLLVVEEIQRGARAGYSYLQPVEKIFSPLFSTGWLPVLSLQSANEQALFIEMTYSLGPGEASCLALAITHHITLGSDDLAARRMANTHGIKLTGTLGILVRLVQEQQLELESANSSLAQMIALRYRSPVARLDDLI
jgi:predicted nucleic acid-binding protein